MTVRDRLRAFWRPESAPREDWRFGWTPEVEAARHTRGRRRRVLVSGLGIVLALAALRVFVLGPPGLASGNGSEIGAQARVGEDRTFCFQGLEPQGSRPVRLRSARLTGVPRGLQVVGIWGLDGVGPCGYNGDPEPALRARLRPVSDVVLHPGAPYPEWTLVVVLTATEPGDWVTKGVDVDWSTRWRRGTAHVGERYRITSTPRPLPPDSGVH